MDFVEVKNVDNTKHYKGKVYDLKVHGEDHTYKINGYTVHNSGGGSLVLYSLGITELDPLKYGLIFERFLSQTRSPDSVINYFCEDKNE